MRGVRNRLLFTSLVICLGVIAIIANLSANADIINLQEGKLKLEAKPIDPADRQLATSKSAIRVQSRERGESPPISVSNTGPNTGTEKPPYTGPANVPNQSKNGGEDIATATVIPSLPYVDFGSTTGFLDDYDEICPSASSSPDVVYSYSPPVNEVVDISTCNAGTSYDTKIYVYENGYTPGAPYACNDDYCPDWTSKIVNLALTGGNTYYIVVDGWDGDFGDYELSVEPYEPPPSFECPPGAIAEAEACGDDTNGGCNMEVPAFEPINCDETVCGTAWADGSNRDTDWYELIVTEQTIVTFSGMADFPMVIGFIDTSDCALVAGIDPYVSAAAGELLTVSRMCSPGTYWLFAANQSWENVAPCGTDNDYWVSVSCAPCAVIDYACNVAFYWHLPGGYPITEYGMRFTTPGETDSCTLSSVGIQLYQPESVDVTGLGVNLMIYADDGFGLPGALLSTINVPSADIQWFPTETTVNLSSPIKVLGDFHVSIGDIHPQDIFAVLSDDATCGDNRGIAYYEESWSSMTDLFGPTADYNFLISAEVCCGAAPAAQPPYVTNHPATLTRSYCGSIYYDFFGESADGSDFSFSLLSGPGTMNSDGEWNFDTDGGDIGNHQLQYQIVDEWGASTDYLTDIEIVNNPPEFSGCDTTIYGTEGDHIVHFMQAIAPERCELVSYTLWSELGTVDPVTGVYSLDAGPTSVGVSSIIIAASDNMGESWMCLFTLDISPDEGGLCGDANGDGITNVGDAVYLINFVFKGGPAPDPVTLGDANDDGITNVGDAVYLINYVFKGGPEPCAVSEEDPCCTAPACAPNADVAVTYKKIASSTVDCGGDFGLWESYAVTATYDACCKDGDTWQMRVKKCESTYSISSCAQGRTDINVVADVGNLADCKKVVADLEFTGAPAPTGRPARATYTSTSCTQVHEEKHQSEWETAFDAEWDTAEPLIEALETACVIPTVDTPAEAVAVMKADADALVKAADAAAWANTPKHGPPDDSGAYAAHKVCHDALIAALKAAFAGC